MFKFIFNKEMDECLQTFYFDFIKIWWPQLERVIDFHNDFIVNINFQLVITNA